jgi:hypothetical protein
MKQVKILLAFLVFVTSATAQTDLAMNEGGNKYVNQLISEKVDSIVVLSATYFRHKSQDVVYIFWKKDGQTKVFDEHNGEATPVPADKAETMWNYLAANHEAIKKEELKPWSHAVMVKGKKKVETPYMEDADWQKCGIYLNGQTTRYTIVSSVVTKTTTTYPGNKKQTNINYEHNMKTKRKLFLDIVGELAPEL